MAVNCERHGNFFAFTLLMHTTHCEEVMKPHFEDRNISFAKMRETCQILIAWDRFLLDANERWMYDDGMHGTLLLMKRIKKHFPKEVRKKSQEKGNGSNGWHIVKFHVMFMVMANCLKFGSARVTHGGAAEKNHKFFVKRLAEETQRRLDTFASQIANNYFEHTILKKAYKKVRKHCISTKGFNKYTSSDHTEDSQFYTDAKDMSDFDDVDANQVTIDPSFNRYKDALLIGSYSMTISIDGRHAITGSHRWKNTTKQKISNIIKPHPLIHFALGRAAIKYAQNAGLSVSQSFDIEGFTSLTVPIHYGDDKTTDVRFKCTPMEYDKEWYDFALIRMPKTIDKENGDTCVAKVLGFFQYKSRGCLTFKKVMVENKPIQQAMTSMDDTMYMLVQCEEGFTEYQDLTKTFVKRITLQSQENLHIIPIGCIIGPLLVVPDIIKKDVVSKNDFIVAMGYHKWGSYFRHFCMKLRERREEGESNSSSDTDSMSLLDHSEERSESDNLDDENTDIANSEDGGSDQWEEFDDYDQS